MKQSTINNVNSNSTDDFGPKYYSTAQILDKELKMLLDCGSQVTIISATDCPTTVLERLAPASISLTAYNDSQIEILGVFQTDIQIGQIKISQTPVYVTNHAYQPILGTTALHTLSVDFKNKQISMGHIKETIYQSVIKTPTDNFQLKVQSQPDANQEHQLLAEHEVTIAPRSEVIIKTVTNSNFADYGVFVTEPETNQVKNCIIARSISRLSQTHQSCIVRLCNVSTEIITIQKNDPIVCISQIESIRKKTTSAAPGFLSKIQIGNIDQQDRTKIKDLLIKYQSVFADDNDELGHIKTVHFDLDTGSAAPISQNKYKTPYFLRNELKSIIDRNVEIGLMEPCSSPWAAPVLLVKKPSGKWRLVCDYRQLNKVTTSDQYPLPEINDCVNELAESRFFSATDLCAGFHQIPTTEKAKKKLAIITDFGQFTWRRMPMGAKNCPAVFQRMMDSVFTSMPTSSLVIYLDDILCHSKTIDEHLIRLEEMFQILEKNQLQIRPDKTLIAQDEIKFCGYRIKNGQKYPNTDKIQAITDLRIPKNKKEAQILFGMLNYHRIFIKDFSKKAAPISTTYHAKNKFQWTNAADQAFKQLKSEISNITLTLKIPVMSKAKFVLETDASDSGFGGTLYICQHKEVHTTHSAHCLRPVEYMSKQFTPAQRKYYIQEKELFAGKEAMRKWRYYLLGRKFDWLIDNACLKWAYRIRSTKLRISQWLAEISEMDLNTVLRKSSQMKVTDCLSRQFAEINAVRVSQSEIAQYQENDETLKQVRNFLVSDRWPNQPSDDIAFFKKRRAQFLFGRHGELLCHDHDQLKLVIPKCLEQELIKTYHDEVGHPGIQKTTEDLEAKYIWINMQTQIIDFIKTCSNCQRMKPNLRPRKPPLGESETPDQPFQLLAFDLIGPLSMTERESQYALVGTDLFSKRIDAVPLTSKRSFQIAHEIAKICLKNPNLPKTILTDHGTEFQEVSTFCTDRGIYHAKSPPYHPSTNGAVERMNQTLKNRLLDPNNSADWDILLPEITHAINSSQNFVTKMTPFEIETGIRGQNIHDQIDYDGTEPTSNLEQSRQTAKNRISREKLSRTAKYANETFIPYNVGELVLTKNHLSKLPRYIGPYTIIKTRGSGYSYELQDTYSQRIIIRQAEELKPYKLRNPPETARNDSTNRSEDTTYSAMPDNLPSTAYFEDDFEINFFPPLNTDPAATRPNPSEETNISLEEPNLEIPPDNNSSTGETPNASFSDQSLLFSDENLPSPATSDNEDNPTEEQFESTRIVTPASEPSVDTQSHSSDNSRPISPGFILRKKQTGRISPTNTAEFQLKLYEMRTNEIQDLADLFNITVSGTILTKKHQIDEFFRLHYPDHPRTDKGHLVFQATFNPCEQTALMEMSTIELEAIIKAYELPKQKLFSSKDLYTHVKKQLLKKFPNAQLENGDIVFKRRRNKNPDAHHEHGSTISITDGDQPK